MLGMTPTVAELRSHILANKTCVIHASRVRAHCALYVNKSVKNHQQRRKKKNIFLQGSEQKCHFMKLTKISYKRGYKQHSLKFDHAPPCSSQDPPAGCPNIS